MITGGRDFTDGDHPGDFVLKKPRATIVTLGDLLPAFLDKLSRGEPPVVWPVDSKPWGTFAFRPGRVIVIGAPTNIGKTAIAVDMSLRAVAMTPGLRVMLASVEEDIDEDLLCRVIAGQLQISKSHVENRNRDAITDADMSRIEERLAMFESRLLIARRPFTLEEVIQAAEDFRPEIVVLDHLQDLRLEDFDGDLVERMRRVMAMVRSLADKGPCVFAISQLSREGTRHVEHMGGRKSYTSSDMGVFQGGTPIEYGMNDGYLLLNDGGGRAATLPGEDDDAPRPMWLQHLKARSGVIKLVPLWFEPQFQRFTLRELDGPAAQAAKPASKPRRTPGRSTGLAPESPTPSSPADQVRHRPKEATDDHWLT